MSETPDLQDTPVVLTAPDGRVFRFRYGATIPLDGQDYVVLLEMENDPAGQDQILVTRLTQENGELSFAVEEDADRVAQVFALYSALPADECCRQDHSDAE